MALCNRGRYRAVNVRHKLRLQGESKWIACCTSAGGAGERCWRQLALSEPRNVWTEGGSELLPTVLSHRRATVDGEHRLAPRDT